MWMPDLKQLRTLAALHETGSLKRAAQRLHLTESALSHQLRELEHRLGLAVVSRERRPFTFTPAGNCLLKLAGDVLPALEAARAALEQQKAGQAGRLAIAIECHSCFDWLLPALDDYRPRWPAVDLDLSLAHAFDPLPALLRGELDAAITADPVSLPGLQYAPLFRYQALLVMANDHPLTARRRIQPADLAGQTLITYPVARQRLDIYRKFLDPAGVDPAAARSTELTVMMLQWVASGRGVAALPSFAVHEHLARGYVSARPLAQRGLWSTLYCAVRSAEARRAYILDFIATARTVSAARLAGIRPLPTPAPKRVSAPRGGRPAGGTRARRPGRRSPPRDN